jgi:Holliday junction DNA helicase RuvB
MSELLEYDEKSLRPRNFLTYIGQERVLSQMKVFVQSALSRSDILDHTLLYGPPGLGKTTLANVIAFELGVEIVTTSGPIIEKAGDLAALLTQLKKGDILFIDEIHRLSHSIEEILYPAMEDFQLDLMVGEGPGARSMRIQLEQFCLIGATTRAGSLSAPLRDRFGIQGRMDYYSLDSLTEILRLSSEKLEVKLGQEQLKQIASRSRGTPRIANRLLKRVRDYIEVANWSTYTHQMIDEILLSLEIDEHGLDHADRKLLICLFEKFQGGPVGLDTLSQALGEQRQTLEEVIEPYLVQQDFLLRTPRGRVLTEKAVGHLMAQKDKEYK